MGTSLGQLGPFGAIGSLRFSKNNLVLYAEAAKYINKIENTPILYREKLRLLKNMVIWTTEPARLAQNGYSLQLQTYRVLVGIGAGQPWKQYMVTRVTVQSQSLTNFSDFAYLVYKKGLKIHSIL